MQVLSEQASDSSAFLYATCLLKYVLNCEQQFLIFRSRLAGVYCTSLGVNWIHLAQDRDQWGALVKAIMNTGLFKDSDPVSKSASE
jgi:hypothetical protein